MNTSDRLRKMTDAELSEFLAIVYNLGWKDSKTGYTDERYFYSFHTYDQSEIDEVYRHDSEDYSLSNNDEKTCLQYESILDRIENLNIELFILLEVLNKSLRL